jgi:hypothetical protein
MQMMWRNRLSLGNAAEMPVYFDVPSNHTIDDAGAKFVVVKT